MLFNNLELFTFNTPNILKFFVFYRNIFVPNKAA